PRVSRRSVRVWRGIARRAANELVVVFIPGKLKQNCQQLGRHLLGHLVLVPKLLSDSRLYCSVTVRDPIIGLWIARSDVAHRGWTSSADQTREQHCSFRRPRNGCLRTTGGDEVLGASTISQRSAGDGIAAEGSHTRHKSSSHGSLLRRLR